jgi:lactoylglutathione lyase
MSPRALFETHLNVRDLNRSVAFYRDIVGLELVYRLDERHVAFFWIGGRGRTMLGLWSGHLSPNVMRLHIAFSLNLDEVIAAPVTLGAAGIEPLDFFGQSTAEPSVIGWMPAASVFFDARTATCWSMSRCCRTCLGPIPGSCHIATGCRLGRKRSSRAA